jgi:DNA polymerase III subunit epsilon
MREIVIDAETRLDPLDGDRVVEIGAVELVDHSPTGQTVHTRRAMLQARSMKANALSVDQREVNRRALRDR